MAFSYNYKAVWPFLRLKSANVPLPVLSIHPKHCFQRTFLHHPPSTYNLHGYINRVTTLSRVCTPAWKPLYSNYSKHSLTDSQRNANPPYTASVSLFDGYCHRTYLCGNSQVAAVTQRSMTTSTHPTTKPEDSNVPTNPHSASAFDSAHISIKETSASLEKPKKQLTSVESRPHETTVPPKFLQLKTFIFLGAGLIGSGYVYSYCNDHKLSFKEFCQLILKEIETKQTVLSDKVDDLFDVYFPQSTEALLPDAKDLNYPEFLPTLVIDFDNTIAHLEHDRRYGWRVVKRPSADRFFKELSNYYEMVIWSDDPFPVAQDVAQKWGLPVVGCLHRDQCKRRRGHYVKDIGRLGRRLERTIILDHDPMAFMFHPENGILVREFKGDPEDRELENLIGFLKDVAVSSKDVRSQIQKYDSAGFDIGRQFLMEKAEKTKRAETRRSIGRAFGMGSKTMDTVYGNRTIQRNETH